jgi:hypothetical protein
MAAADKILRRMKRSLTGWHPQDFATLYNGYGFLARDGANHTVYVHSVYPHLRATVARHGALAKGYAEHALDIIAELESLQAQETTTPAEED